MTELIEEDKAIGKTKEIYQDIKNHFGMIPNLLKSMAATDPDWLELNWKREKKIMLEDGPLDKKTCELIAFAVSVVNNCDYCVLVHEAMAINRGATKQQLGHARQVIDLFSSFNAIANSHHDLVCDVKPE